MNNSELEALRRLLFFSATEAAALVGGVAEQTWRRWEAGARSVPADVAEQMLVLIDWREQALSTVINSIDSVDGSDVVIVWYEVLDDWASLAGREPVLWRPHQSVCAAALAAYGNQIRLVPFDGPAYATWLAGRNDSETLRSEWAAQTD